jgi:hypothetical protein
MYLSDSAKVPVGCENMDQCELETHNQREKQYSQVPTHNLHLRRKQIFYTKNS